MRCATFGSPNGSMRIAAVAGAARISATNAISFDWSASLGNDASLIGASLYGQWLVIDPQAPDGIASSDGARWTVF